MSHASTPSQQKAIRARGNVLVVAGAGTGKTSTLVQRCLTLLEEGCSLENILMVTFTEAAAVEMRGRIRTALRDKLEALRTGPGADARGAEHFEKQLALLDVALISTLHSFCLQLVREHFYELGIDPDVLVLTEQQTRPLEQRALDAVLERHYAGDTDLDRAVQALVRQHGRGSDESIRALILRLHRYSQSLADPDGWLEEQEGRFGEVAPTLWRGWFVETFPAWRKPWLKTLMDFAGIPAVDLTVEALRALPAKPTAGNIARALQAIRSADDDTANWPRGSKTNIRSRLKDFFDETKFLASLTPALAREPLAEDWEQVRQQMLALLTLAREFEAEFSRAKRELAGVDFADLEQFALRLLRNADSRTFTAAAARWRRQLHYVFVDEYQDINAAQDAILCALSREGADANRFLVGDMKQSIYRFRLANPAIFRRYDEHWKTGEGGSQSLPLSDNFRSHPGILDFVNPLFRALMRESVGGVAYEELNFGGGPERSDAGDGGPRVEFHLITRSGDSSNSGEEEDAENAGSSQVADLLATEREARLVALRLRELRDQKHPIWDKDRNCFRPATWRDMAVLLRSPAGRAEAFAQEFARLGVPLEAARGGFFSSLEISDLVCLLKLLDNPLQDIPLLAVLRSPLVGMSVAELAEIRAGEKPERRAPNFWLAAGAFRRQGNPAGSGWRKLDHFFRRLDRWRALIRQTSLSQCLETALAETQYEALLLALPRGEQQAENVRRLLALSREYDPFQRQGLFRFLRFIEAQAELETEPEPVPTNLDAVRLLSIHKSKGLEFPVVVVAGLGCQFNSRDLHELILLDETYGLCPKVLPPDAASSYPSLPYWLGQRRQRREMLGEELRLLYVAMTRARDTLLLTASSRAPADAKWAAADARELSDLELLGARSSLDWLKLWLPQVTLDSDWSGDRGGQSKLLRWKIYTVDDPRLHLPEPGSAGESSQAGPAAVAEDPGLPELQARLAWKYPFTAATGQRAKTTVTELRRGRDEEAEVAGFIQRRKFTFPEKRKQALTGSEKGVAHHRFLQAVSLSKTGGAEELRSEAERLTREKWLSVEEAAALDFDALAQFWQSDFGRSVAANAPAARRELQFTARFTAADLAGSGLEPAANLAVDEFVVVQGMVDLAVLLPKEIWLVDFKTDEFGEDERADKIKSYAPQLKLYARALEGIYNRPVTECRLHFLSQRSDVRIQR